MLSRRSLRIKVMQAVYAHERGAFTDRIVAEKELLKNVRGSFSLFLYHLYFLGKAINYVHHEAEIRATKHLRTDDDKNFNTRIAGNSIVEDLLNSESFKKHIKALKLDKYDDEAAVRTVFQSFVERDSYKLYGMIEAPGLEEDREVLIKLYNKAMTKNEFFQQHIEENFAHSVDELQIINFKMNELLKTYEPGKTLEGIGKMANPKEDENFATELLELTLEHQEEFRKMIEPKLQNWDPDRIATMDLLLMRMALAELLYFPTIPVKVTINEYIEIAKIYSTPRSKDFINGILDKLMNELKENGKIKKSGRGLQG